MEPINAYGDRVGDFYNYVSSKTANALWSNITTLSVDDCIILCNKAVYDALGQRELLRILDEADDQCDAAGTVITQAAANMPNVPMQFSISFVESITADEKKGLFGFKKKSKEEDTSNMSIKSTVDGGIIGAAAEAIAGAGFVSGLETAVEAEAASAVAADAAGVAFGDNEMPKTYSLGAHRLSNNMPERYSLWHVKILGVHVFSLFILGNSIYLHYLCDKQTNKQRKEKYYEENLYAAFMCCGILICRQRQ